MLPIMQVYHRRPKRPNHCSINGGHGRRYQCWEVQSHVIIIQPIGAGGGGGEGGRIIWSYLNVVVPSLTADLQLLPTSLFQAPTSLVKTSVASPSVQIAGTSSQPPHLVREELWREKVVGTLGTRGKAMAGRPGPEELWGYWDCCLLVGGPRERSENVPVRKRHRQTMVGWGTSADHCGWSMSAGMVGMSANHGGWSMSADMVGVSANHGGWSLSADMVG